MDYRQTVHLAPNHRGDKEAHFDSADRRLGTVRGEGWDVRGGHC